MAQVKKILILMADMGFGHRNAAQAVAAALKETHGDECVVELVNPLDDERTPTFMRNLQIDYDQTVRQMPGLRKLGYEITDAPLPNAVIERALTVSLYDVLRSIVRERKPDAIVSTYQNYLAPLDAVFTLGRRRVPLITVITDLVSLQRIWFNDGADVCCVPTQQAYELAISYGLPGDGVKLTGIPVNPRLAGDHRDQADLQAELGWHRGLYVALVVGSKRVLRLCDALQGLNHSALPLQMVLVAGGDSALYQAFLATDWHIPVHIYNFVEDMPTLLRASNFVISKAGGLIVSESLACGLPILLIDVIEGWETGNAQYVIENEAGERANSPLEVLAATYHWLADGGRVLVERSTNARKLGTPRAAYDIAELTWQAAQRGPYVKEDTARMPKLADLLSQFNISSQDVGR